MNIIKLRQKYGKDLSLYYERKKQTRGKVLNEADENIIIMATDKQMAYCKALGYRGKDLSEFQAHNFITENKVYTNPNATASDAQMKYCKALGYDGPKLSKSAASKYIKDHTNK